MLKIEKTEIAAVVLVMLEMHDQEYIKILHEFENTPPQQNKWHALRRVLHDMTEQRKGLVKMGEAVINNIVLKPENKSN